MTDSLSGQTMQEAWKNIGKYVVHTHFKDSYKTDEVDDGFKYCLMGDGEIPTQEALQILKDSGYNGSLPFEIEIAALCERDDQRAEQAKAEYNIDRIYREPGDFSADQDIDCYAVVVTPSTLKPLLQHLSRPGKPILT